MDIIQLLYSEDISNIEQAVTSINNKLMLRKQKMKTQTTLDQNRKSASDPSSDDGPCGMQEEES